jgi:hypothetical protein
MVVCELWFNMRTCDGSLGTCEEREREARRRWADAEERATRLKEMVDNGERDRERLEGELQAALSGP